jgi:hypothetical protein
MLPLLAFRGKQGSICMGSLFEFDTCHFLTNIKRGVMKALELVEPPERVDGKTPEAYQVSNHHFDAFLELTNGDMEDGYITREELGALQVAGYCNVATHYIHDRAGKLPA